MPPWFRCPYSDKQHSVNLVNMQKQINIQTVIVLLLLVWTAFLSAQDKPNFVVIMIDDQGYQDLGCYGSPEIKTPRLDQMAQEGMRFTSFYAQTVCGPARAALMTGCYPMRVQRAENDIGEVPHPAMSLDEITVAELLKPFSKLK